MANREQEHKKKTKIRTGGMLPASQSIHAKRGHNMQSSLMHSNYVLTLVMGHFEIWVAFVPFHTVRTSESSTRTTISSSKENEAEVLSIFPLPFHLLAEGSDP